MDTHSTIIGIDLGGTKIAIARFDAHTMERQGMKVIETPKTSYEEVEATVLDQIDVMRRDDTMAIGIGVPGLVRSDDHRIVRMPNIPGAENRDLASVVQKETGLAVDIANDAGCFTLAEALFGVGKNHRVVVGIAMGTGVGGGIVMGGMLFRGEHGFAGEVGHMLLKPGEPPYPTKDLRGDVEQFLSGTAMGKRCDSAKRPEDYLDGEVCEWMRPEIFREVAWMVTNLAHAIDPSIVVFGGSAGRALRPHLDAIRKELKTWMLPGAIIPDIAVGTLDDAAVRGAAMLLAKNYL
jgi:predicted NBD/HSP70 family sugar kinase